MVTGQREAPAVKPGPRYMNHSFYKGDAWDYELRLFVPKVGHRGYFKPSLQKINENDWVYQTKLTRDDYAVHLGRPDDTHQPNALMESSLSEYLP